jgi:hypothetical protein
VENVLVAPDLKKLGNDDLIDREINDRQIRDNISYDTTELLIIAEKIRL